MAEFSDNSIGPQAVVLAGSEVISTTPQSEGTIAHSVENSPAGRSIEKTKKKSRSAIFRWGTEEKSGKGKGKGDSSGTQNEKHQEGTIATGGPSTATAIKEGSEQLDALEKSKHGDFKKTQKLNKELSKQNTQLSKSVESLKKERETLLSEKQKLKGENKLLEKELKRVMSSPSQSEIERLREQLAKYDSPEEESADKLELKEKVERLEAQLAEKMEEIAVLQRKLELQAELRQGRKKSVEKEQVVGVEVHGSPTQIDVPETKIVVIAEENGDASAPVSVTLDRLLEEQDVSSRLRRENAELKVRISSLESEMEQVHRSESTSELEPKGYKTLGSLFRKGRKNRHSSDGSHRDDDEPVASLEVESHPFFRRGRRHTVDHLSSKEIKSVATLNVSCSNDELGPRSPRYRSYHGSALSPSPSLSHYRTHSGSLIQQRGDTQTLQACLKLALEEKKLIDEQKNQVEEDLLSAKGQIEQLRKNMTKVRKISQGQEVEILKQTLKVALSDKTTLGERVDALQEEIESLRARNTDIEKSLKDMVAQRDSRIKDLEEEMERLKREKEEESKRAKRSIQLRDEEMKRELELQSEQLRKEFEKRTEELKREFEQEKSLSTGVKTTVCTTNTKANSTIPSTKPPPVVENPSGASTKPPTPSTKPPTSPPAVGTNPKPSTTESTGRPKLRRMSSSELSIKVAAAKALFEGKIEDSKAQVDAADPKRRRPSLKDRNKKSLSSQSSSSGNDQVQSSKEVLSPTSVITSPTSPQSKDTTISMATPVVRCKSVDVSSSVSKKPGNTTNGNTNCNSSSTEKLPIPATSSKVSISVKSSMSPSVSPKLSTRKEFQKEVPVASSKPDSNTTIPVPIPMPTQGSTARKETKSPDSIHVSQSQPILHPLKKEVTSGPIQIRSQSISDNRTKSPQHEPPRKSPVTKTLSFPSYVTTTVHSQATSTDLATKSSSLPTKTMVSPTNPSRVILRQPMSRLNVADSMDVRRATSLQDIPEKTNSYQSSNENGARTSTSIARVLTSSPVPLRAHKRTTRERPASYCRADTVNLTSVISRLQDQEKKGGSGGRPVSFYGGETSRVEDFAPQPRNPRLQRAATISGGYDRRLSKKALLLRWCQRVTEEYGNLTIENFGESFASGLAFCAILHHFIPDKIPYETLTADSRERNFKVAFEAAEDVGVPQLLDVEDMVALPIPDWMSVMTYVSFIYKQFGQKTTQTPS